MEIFHSWENKGELFVIFLVCCREILWTWGERWTGGSRKSWARGRSGVATSHVTPLRLLMVKLVPTRPTHSETRLGRSWLKNLLE